MELKNMKNTPKKGEKDQVIMAQEPAYPWGLSIRLDNESLKKLGITDLPDVGQKFMLHALVEVDAVSSHHSQEGEDKSLGLQITDMALEKPVKKPDAGQRLYGDA